MAAVGATSDDVVASVPDAIARAWSATDGFQLDREDVALLAGVYAWTEFSPDESLDEDRLLDLHRIVVEVAHRDHDASGRLARAAVARLHTHGMLHRVDASGIVRTAEYGLSPIGRELARFLLERDPLTRRSLLVLTTRIRADLSAVRDSAKKGGDASRWSDEVEGPLRLSVSALMEGVDRRQMGMDRAQEETRARVTELLEQSWFEAVESCEALLGETAATLRELHDTLLQEVTGIDQLLTEIHDLAVAADQAAAAATVEAVQARVERIGAWGVQRLEAWSDYYGVVNGFIRSFVRVDRDRAIVERIRIGLQAWPSMQWSLRVTRADPWHAMKEDDYRVEAPPQSRPRRPPPSEPEQLAWSPDLLDEVVATIEALLATQGQADISKVLGDHLSRLGPDDRHRLVGETLEALALRGRACGSHEWVRLVDALEVQDLTVRRPRDAN